MSSKRHAKRTGGLRGVHAEAVHEAAAAAAEAALLRRRAVAAAGRGGHHAAAASGLEALRQHGGVDAARVRDHRLAAAAHAR